MTTKQESGHQAASSDQGHAPSRSLFLRLSIMRARRRFVKAKAG